MRILYEFSRSPYFLRLKGKTGSEVSSRSWSRNDRQSYKSFPCDCISNRRRWNQKVAWVTTKAAVWRMISRICLPLHWATSFMGHLIPGRTRMLMNSARLPHQIQNRSSTWMTALKTFQDSQNRHGWLHRKIAQDQLNPAPPLKLKRKSLHPRLVHHVSALSS